MSAETATPQRNFTVPAEERVRALVGGPPAYLRRLRAMEDLEEAIARQLTQGARGASLARRAAERPLLEADLARLNALIERHNRFYPIEADLPICVRTGQLLDRNSAPWRPRPARSLDDFVRPTTRTTTPCQSEANESERDQTGASEGSEGKQGANEGKRAETTSPEFRSSRLDSRRGT